LLGAFLDCLHALVTSPLPVVAAINGHSPAGGAVLALHCDVRFMARGAGKIGLNEVAVGLYPGALIHAVLTRTVGPRTAERLLSQGLLLDADEALVVGLIDAVTAPEDLDRESLQWLAAVAALPPTAYRRTRSLVRADLVQLVTDAAVTRRESVVAELAREWCSAEMRETLAALLARR
jgi:enoyl-CoA hydratase/carnithine racemase